MKTIIAGSREIEDYQLLLKCISESGFEISHIISGGARGVDALAERYAKENEIPITIFYAQWKKYAALGKLKVAGHDRNKTMSENAEALIAICLNKSRGTLNMIENAEKKGLKVFVKHIEKPSVDKPSAGKLMKKLPDNFYNS